MSPRRLLIALLAALALPASLTPGSAGAHAYLVDERPQASVVVKQVPGEVRLGYSEPVEPEFAVISVTDKDAKRMMRGRPAHVDGDRSVLRVPLEKLEQGWYLVYWRVVSADGHPIRGAYTFAVGPTPGPPPEFDVPSLDETAATPTLLVLRWVALLAAMTGIGLLLFRLLIARPLLRRVPGASLRAVSTGMGVSLGVAILATLAYVNESTADFAEASFLDLATTIPAWRESSFGRGFVDFAIVLTLLAVAAAAAVALDRPDRERRSVAEIGATGGALAAAAAALLVPGLAGHAGQYSPRGATLSLDWAHLLAGSIWIGGLVGITLVAWRAAARRVACMVVVIPRFSRVALGAVLLLVATGTATAVLRLPTLESLWETGYGQALVAKIAILLGLLVLAAVNLLRTRPRLEATSRRPGLGEPTTRLLRRLVGGEVALLVGALFAASIMSSVAPPPDALARASKASAQGGPGPLRETVREGDLELDFAIAPNRAARPSAFDVEITRDGEPVTDAAVTARFTMLDMEMGQQTYKFPERGGGRYGNPSLPALVMAGHWGLDFTIRMPGEKPVNVLLLDKVGG